MIRIRLFDHPLAPVAPKEFEAESLGLWLLDHYGPVPDVMIQIFKGAPCAENEISGDLAAILASDADEYTVLQSPGAPVVVTFLINMAIAVAISLVMSLLAPDPAMPANVNRSQQSPNNKLAGRDNQVRFLERVEDIYGTVRAIPSLMMPTYNKYISHRQYEYGYYCIGRGYYDIDELRDGDTLIGDIEGSSAAVYEPFTSPNYGSPVVRVGDPIIDSIATVRRAVEVDGITLKAANQVQLPARDTYTFDQGNRITQANKRPSFDAVLSPGNEVVIEMEPAEVVIGPGDPGAIPPIDPVIGTVDYSGTYTVASVGTGVMWVDGADFHTPVSAADVSIQADGTTHITDWVTIPDKGRTEVWFNIVASGGMFKDDGGRSVATVNFRFDIEKLDPVTLAPTGIVEAVNSSLSGSTQDERADTIEHATGWTGPARVRAQRTSDYDYDFNGTVVDEIKWADLYSVTPVTKAEFGNKTTIHTVTKATARATAARTRQINCIASRRLPTFNGSTFSGAFDASGRHVSGTIAATSRIVDIIAAVSVDPQIGNRDLATEIDMAQIWGAQQQLDAWNAECGQFNYTFDSDNISFEETLVHIANAAFCTAYRQNGKMRLAFERAQANSTALFTHRNKKPNAEKLTRTFAGDSEYDAVEFVYVDPDSNQSETITLPLDGGYTKARKFEYPGIRSFAQAWYRANREYEKIKGQRLSIETETTLDARSLLPNSRIDIADNTRFKSYDGEVIGQDGMELTLSQRVEFTAGLPHSIVLMRRDGSLQSIRVTAGAAANKVILQNLPSETVFTQYDADDGIRTIFSFAADSARGAMAYLVQEIDVSDGQYAMIRAINYSDDYYRFDHQPIPPKDAIIN